MVAGLALALGTAGCASGGDKVSTEGESERYLRLGYVQLERGQTQEAMASAKTAIERDPKNADAHNFMGLICMSQSDYQQAADHLREAVRLNPFFTDAHNNLGAVYRELKQYDRSLAELQAALKDKTYRTPEKIQLNLGNLYFDQGVMSEAIRWYEQAVSTSPTYVRGHLALGAAYQKAGRGEQAAQQFRRVLELAPGTPEAARAQQELEAGARRSGS
jgi:Tfp pilus assembly protein PilF